MCLPTAWSLCWTRDSQALLLPQFPATTDTPGVRLQAAHSGRRWHDTPTSLAAKLCPYPGLKANWAGSPSPTSPSPLPTPPSEASPLKVHASLTAGGVCSIGDVMHVVYLTVEIKPFSVWWSKSRIDYILETPRGSDSLDLLRPTAFAHVVHSRYWEAKELCSFILTRVGHIPMFPFWSESFKRILL